MLDDDRATPPGDDQPPALPAPGDRGDDESRGRPEGRAIRSYTPVERAGLMWLAVRDGVSATADAHNVPRSTLTTWLEETGGVGPVKEWLCAETLGAFLRFEQDFYTEATRRLQKLPNSEFGMTLRALISARTGILAAQGQDGQPPAAAAAAKATVELHVTEVDGKVSVIDLGTPPEDEQGEPGYEPA